MTKFYFTAVSNSEKKKIVGSFDAEDEKGARERINRVGMAILSIKSEPPADWGKAFEFSVTEVNGNEFAGEIAEDSIGIAFARLEDEFNFQNFNYIFPNDISEEEKIAARKNSVEELMQKRKEEEAKKTDLEKRTFAGSLKTLATLKVDSYFADKKKVASTDENVKKFSNEGEEDLTKKSAADFPDPNAPQPDQSAGVQKSDIDSLLQEDDLPTAEEKTLSWREKLQKIKDGLIHFFPETSKKLSEFYFHFTEIVVPPEGKTRRDGWNGMRDFFFPPKDPDEILKLEQLKVLKHKMILNKFWITFEEIIDLLAAVFLGYLALGMISFYVEIPRISELAESTLRDNYTIHFMAGSFTFFRVLIFIREKFTNWSFLRTALLFLIGSFVVIFAGLNLL